MKRKIIICTTAAVAIIFICIFSSIKISKSKPTANQRTDKGQLTTEQKLSDFNYMYDLMKDNFANFENVKEQYNYDWLNHKKEFKNMIEQTKNNDEFYSAMYDILNKLNQGHTSFLDSGCFKYYREVYNKYASTGNTKKWADVLNNPKALNLYDSTNLKFKYPQDSQSNSNESSDNHASFKILENNNIAYLKVPSMGDELIENDRPKIYEFLKQIKDYPYLIIDIRGNEGGNDLYWIKNIVSPLIENDISYKKYSFIKGGKYSMAFYKDRLIKSDAKIKDISKLSSQIKCPKYIKKDFKYFKEDTCKINSENYVGFKGKIFIFTDKGDFSSSEDFAVFCKTTRWATLVGTNTGGDGMGIDPIVAMLPNSGLIFRFTAETSFNSDGKSNERYGTSPDLYVSGTTDDYINAMKKYICK